MVFSAPLFIFLFLPLVLCIYYILPYRLRNTFLLASSLLFYFYGERSYTVVMILMIALNYGFGLWIARKGMLSKKLLIGICIALNLSILGYFKYYNFFIEAFNDVFSFAGITLANGGSIHLPIGISFFTFQALSYVIDTYRGEVKVQRNPANLALYIALFPQLIAGPIVRYADIERAIEKRKHLWKNFSYGIERFIFGLAKKVLIANSIAFYVDKIFVVPDNELSTALVWLGVIGYALQIYFDFSAYSDMAIGLGRMFGLKFLENFEHPYIAVSIQDFWRRWHISLSTWFRDYLYIPLGGSRQSTLNTYRNLLIVFFLTGLWHGASYNFIIWGFLHGLFLIIERAGFSKVLNRLPMIVKSGYVLVVVLIGWVFFRAETLAQAYSFLTKMFSFSSSLQADAHFAFIIDSNFLVMLAIGVLFSIPIRRWVFEDCFLDHPTASFPKRILYTGITICVFLISVIFLAAGTYNPFIYFRF